MWLCWVLVVAWKIFSCGMWDLGITSSLHWGCGVLATGPPGKSLDASFFL